MTTVIQKKWEQPYVGRYGCPDGTDTMHGEIRSHVFNGREYWTETQHCNGVQVYAAQYPAGTDYAEKRRAAYQ